MNTNDSVAIELTADEALVLFEFLQRYTDTDLLRVEHQAEQRMLWNLGCLLEKAIAVPFRSDYGDLLEAARSRLRDEE